MEQRQIADLSNQYYRLLPQKGFEYERVEIMDNHDSLNQRKKNLELLSELEITTRFMLAAMNKKQGMLAV